MNCGAPSEGGTCSSCGMTVTAAEIALRKHFANRTAIFLVGALGFVFASSVYPPLELDGMLIFVGILFFITLGLGVWLERRAVRHQEVEALKRVYYGLVPIPLLLGVLLLGNGALDQAQPENHPTVVVSKFSIGGFWPGRRLVVDSWREGHRFERVAVSSDDFDLFSVGDDIVVRTGGGLVGIPWVSSVSRGTEAEPRGKDMISQ